MAWRMTAAVSVHDGSLASSHFTGWPSSSPRTACISGIASKLRRRPARSRAEELLLFTRFTSRSTSNTSDSVLMTLWRLVLSL